MAREYMEISINDQSFSLLKIQIDNLLKDILTKMTEKEADEGTINIKITLKTEEAALPNKMDMVEKLAIDWKLTGQIVEKIQTDGNVYDADQFYLDWDDPKHPILKRIPKAQHTVDEFL